MLTNLLASITVSLVTNVTNVRYGPSAVPNPCPICAHQVTAENASDKWVEVTVYKRANIIFEWDGESHLATVQKPYTNWTVHLIRDDKLDGGWKEAK